MPAILSNLSEALSLQPALLGVRPVVTQGDVGEISNPEMQKIANDVLDASRLSMTSVVAKPDAYTEKAAPSAI